MRQARWLCVLCHAEVFTKAGLDDHCPACGGVLITAMAPRVSIGPPPIRPAPDALTTNTPNWFDRCAAHLTRLAKWAAERYRYRFIRVPGA